MSADLTRAVFLSYASQDSEAAKRICEALRNTGIEVWFDQSELRGGDAWDAKIRRQIKECALFVPIISANTQARAEGYFRLEWRLADQRTHLMGKSKAFLMPVCIDGTHDANADVPDSFLAVQWTRLSGGESNAAFCDRVKRLLAGDAGRGLPTLPPDGTFVKSAGVGVDPSLPKPILTLTAQRSMVALAAVAALVALALWQPWRRTGQKAAEPAPATGRPANSSELARARARVQPDRWQKQDFDAVSVTLDRLIQANPEEAEAWALRSIINSLQVMRNFDSGTKPLEMGRSAAERALRIAPGSPLGELALGMHLAAIFSRGSDVQVALPHVQRGVAGLPRDALTRYAELTSLWLGYQFDATERSARAWLADEPRASFPAWILGQLNVARRQPEEAVKWAGLAAADSDITGIRARVTTFEARYYLQADLPAARAALEQIPPSASPPHRLLFARWLLAMAERQWDQALRELTRVPEPILFDRNYHGPKALLAGLAHRGAGRTDAALAQLRESERLLRADLASDPDNEELHAVLAVTLASAGRADDARNELAAIEPLMRGRAPSVYTGGMITLIAQAHGAMGDIENTIPWLRKLFMEPSSLPFTPASLRIDSRFERIIAAPPVQALLAEFAALDPPKKAAVGPDNKSVAVLAFADLSAEKDGEYFSDGISEELLNVLAKVPGLRVAARTSAFYFKGKNTPIPEIAKQLNVGYVVEGSVRKAGSRVRITAQLISAADGFHVWSDNFDRELKDIFAVQDEIAGLIATKLQLTLGTPPRATKTVNPEAHRLVLEGRHYWNLRTYDGFTRAEAAYTKALEIAPDFAEAHAGIAQVFLVRASNSILDGWVDVGSDIHRARASAQESIRLEPGMADNYATIGFSLMLDGTAREAEPYFERAYSLNPNSAIGYFYGNALEVWKGRLDDDKLQHALSLDPLWMIALALQSTRLIDQQRFDEALEVNARVAGLRAAIWYPLHGKRARILLALGRKEEAVAVAREVRSGINARPRWDCDANAIWVLQQAGLVAEAEEYTEAVFRLLPGDSYMRGFILAARGTFDQALPYLEHTPIPSMNRLYWDVVFDPFRSDPRFEHLMVKLGCAEEYKTARATLARLLARQTTEDGLPAEGSAKAGGRRTDK